MFALCSRWSLRTHTVQGDAFAKDPCARYHRTLAKSVIATINVILLSFTPKYRLIFFYVNCHKTCMTRTTIETLVNENAIKIIQRYDSITQTMASKWWFNSDTTSLHTHRQTKSASTIYFRKYLKANYGDLSPVNEFISEKIQRACYPLHRGNGASAKRSFQSDIHVTSLCIFSHAKSSNTIFIRKYMYIEAN